MLDLNKIRADFPILGTEVCRKPLIYLDNAATTQKPLRVLNKIVELYSTQNANIHRGVHTLSERATDAHEQARARVARFIGANDACEVVFTRGTTESINLLARTLPEAFCRKGDEIIVTIMDHHSNIVPWQMAAERLGLKLKTLYINEAGQLLVDQLDDLLTERTKIVAFSAVSNVLGTINPVRTIAQKAHSCGALVVVDAAQAVAHMSIDVRTLGADFLAFSGHKVYAPTGIGVLWGRAELFDKMPPFMGGGEMIERVTMERTTYNKMPFKYEAGTPDYIGSVVLAEALDYLTSLDINEVARHEHELLMHATQLVSSIEGVKIIGLAPEKSGVLSFVVDGVHPYDIGTLLDKCGVAVRTGHHCAEPLVDFLGLKGTVRASFALYNTKEEVDAFALYLDKVLRILR